MYSLLTSSYCIGHWGPISCVYCVMEEQLAKARLEAKFAIHPRELWISWLTQWWPIWNPLFGLALSEAGYVLFLNECYLIPHASFSSCHIARLCFDTVKCLLSSLEDAPGSFHEEYQDGRCQQPELGFILCFLQKKYGDKMEGLWDSGHSQTPQPRKQM